MIKFGISEEVLTSIVAVFAKLKKIYRVRIFGSRALGCYKAGSDIDLAVEGLEIDLSYILEIQLKLEELMLPYRFDIVDFNSLNQDYKLREHIERVGSVIFEHKDK